MESSIHAQTYSIISPTPVYIPKSTPIQVLGLTSPDYTTAQKNTIKTTTLAAYPGITFLGDATHTYNWHNFAWYMSGGGTTSVWMNQYNTGKLLGFLDKEHASVWHLSAKKPRLPITIGDAWALAPTS